MPDIEHSIQVAATPQKLHPLVATGPGFKQWWAADVSAVNGAIELGFFKRTTLYRLSLASDEPGNVEWECKTGEEWSGTRLIFALKVTSSGTQLHFTHAGWKARSDYFVSCNTTWGELMFRLKAAAEGKSPGPLFLEGSWGY